MKKIYLMLAVIGTITIAGQAQTGKTDPAKTTTKPKEQGKAVTHETNEQKAQKMVERLDKIVVLTAEQKTKVNNLALKRIKTTDAIHEKYKAQPEKKEQQKLEMEDAHKEYRQSIKKLLTAEQMNKIKEYQKTGKEKGAGNHENSDLPTEQD